ncbi:hypothetical protein BMG03_00865 [Thioclava nitratireducens]|uniref:Aminoglycoside phosphotransferase domain-containing protein n=1 Tax=Thioclava nitratireducens TaxID=1915078 RepID=A0ABN4X8V1_9RHOB|nr:phosphotransferase [Thioclava nitratireducens]AQS46507.1 hypothetical protein BMG03_00865 [Thioclava nitratireducens]
MISDETARAMAESALASWGGAPEPPRLVKNRENIVFEAHLKDGRHVALRLHRPGYQGREGVEAELRWCESLADQGMPVPRPVRTSEGALTGLVEDRVTSCVGWLDGTPIGAGDQPLSGTPEAVRTEAQALGRLIAQLHISSDAAPPDGFDRNPWDGEGFLGERPLWGRFWEHPQLSEVEATTLSSDRDLARVLLAQAQDYGPIHADCLRENVLSTPDGLALIDFDDCGPGYRLYDLATALVQGWGDPLWGEQAAGLVEGYRSLRPLPPDQEALLPLFVALRAFASAGWIVTRALPSDPRQKLYVERALDLAQHLENRTPPWETSR